jgi:hypothetical protein
MSPQANQTASWALGAGLDGAVKAAADRPPSWAIPQVLSS